ncbi:MAG TPA: alpha/beta hydrolase, partial [Flavisolibacter sp.]|nr:alpha/beta hydrolase [Flavisolibacter sp.]
QNKFPILPARLLVKYHFPTYSFLPKVKAPVVMFHGTHDEVISYKQALKLKKENSAATLVTLENGKHNNLSQFPLFQNTLDSLLGR